jgi:cytochrome c2
MRFTRADPAPPDAAVKVPRRPGPWALGLVAAVAAAIAWLTATMAVPATPAEPSMPARRETPDVPVFPVIGAIFVVVLVTAAWLASEAWLAADRSDAVARALTGGDPMRASVLVTRYGCGGCHTVPGLPAANGKVGPPLGGIRQRVFIAGVLPNTADNLISWIVAPRAYLPGSAMPVTGISRTEARDVAAWLYAH